MNHPVEKIIATIVVMIDKCHTRTLDLFSRSGWTQFMDDSVLSGPIDFDNVLHEDARHQRGNIMSARAKAAALLVSLPLVGILALGSAGAANAISCGPGSDPAVASNGAEFCAARNDGGVSGGGGVTVGNGGSTVPGGAAPIVGGNGGVPIAPPAAPAPVPVPAAPAPAYKAPVPAAPAPVKNYTPAVQAPAPVTNVAPAAGTSKQDAEVKVAAPEAAAPAEAKTETTPGPTASASASSSASPSATATASPSSTPSVSETRATGVTYVDRASDNNAAAPIFIALIAGLLAVGASLLFKFKREWFTRKNTEV